MSSTIDENRYHGLENTWTRGLGMGQPRGVVNHGELELLATEVRRHARLSPTDILPAERLARRVMGAGAVETIPRFSTPAMLAAVDGRHRIFVRAGVPDRNFLIAHEVGHWVLRTQKIEVENEEESANFLGAALLVSPSAILRARSDHGDNLGAVARTFDVTQTCARLRLAEVLGEEMALITKVSVRIRTTGKFRWDAPDIVRRWAQGRAPAGLLKRKLTDSPGRIALSFAMP